MAVLGSLRLRGCPRRRRAPIVLFFDHHNEISFAPLTLRPSPVAILHELQTKKGGNPLQMQWPEMDQSTSNRMPTAPKPLIDALSQSNTRYHNHAPVCGHVSAAVAFEPLIKLGQSAASVEYKRPLWILFFDLQLSLIRPSEAQYALPLYPLLKGSANHTSLFHRAPLRSAISTGGQAG